MAAGISDRDLAGKAAPQFFSVFVPRSLQDELRGAQIQPDWRVMGGQDED